jgi:hypothetical protein
VAFGVFLVLLSRFLLFVGSGPSDDPFDRGLDWISTRVAPPLGIGCVALGLVLLVVGWAS